LLDDVLKYTRFLPDQLLLAIYFGSEDIEVCLLCSLIGIPSSIKNGLISPVSSRMPTFKKSIEETSFLLLAVIFADIALYAIANVVMPTLVDTGIDIPVDILNIIEAFVLSIPETVAFTAELARAVNWSAEVTSVVELIDESARLILIRLAVTEEVDEILSDILLINGVVLKS
jgi:hypothetical protein